MRYEPNAKVPRDDVDNAETDMRAPHTSVENPIDDSLAAQVERVRNDKDFTARARAIVARDKGLLDRLAE
jgi:hypothetical protein